MIKSAMITARQRHRLSTDPLLPEPRPEQGPSRGMIVRAPDHLEPAQPATDQCVLRRGADGLLQGEAGGIPPFQSMVAEPSAVVSILISNSATPHCRGRAPCSDTAVS